MNPKQFIFSLLLITLLLFQINSDKIEARIKIDAYKNWTIIYSDFKEEDIYVAQAFYTDSLSQKGWDELSISTNSMFSDELQAEAAGRLEGELTRERIYNHYLNLKNDHDFSDKTMEFLEQQEKFVFDSIEKEGKRDPILYNAYLIKIQYNGIMEQYNLAAEPAKQLTKKDFHIMNYEAEISDIEEKFKVEKYGKNDYTKMDEKELLNIFYKRTHCSALFKIKSDLSEIYFGHNTWDSYIHGIRIIKEYNLNFNNHWVKSKNIIFSSYPATLSSVDDFYIASSGLVVIETTNVFYNDTLYQEIKPESLFTCERAMISNRISNSSKEWVENFIKYNSGTYNNQFMVLDKNKVSLVNKTIDLDAFYIVEQLPGFTKINNVTDILKFGYWSSFNVPFDKDISKISGIKEIIEEKPAMASKIDYDFCARTKIFRREHNSVDTLEAFMKLIRYNKYKTDPFSEGNALLSISARGDLNKDGDCVGAFDAKAGALSEFKDGKVKIHMVSGPTWDDDMEGFVWSKSSEKCQKHSHKMIPDEFKFNWEEYESVFNF